MKGKIINWDENKGIGWISSDECRGNIFIHVSDIQDRRFRNLLPGDEVGFKCEHQPDGKFKAKEVDIISSDTLRSNLQFYAKIKWGYLLPKLANEMALKEQWEFRGEKDPRYPYPILCRYLKWTFFRLVKENKILDKSPYSVFNTGLVDKRYFPIYAFFEEIKNPEKESPKWILKDFCIEGEEQIGKEIARNFRKMPESAQYFNNPSDVLYDISAGEPKVNWKHIIIEDIDRLPKDFIEQHCQKIFPIQDTSNLNPDEKNKYFNALAEAIKKNDLTYRAITNRIKDAVELAIKRVRWNFKTAIPSYFPTTNKMSLLLPLALVSDDVVDIALVVEKTPPSGNYLGHTILPLDLAYSNARLICRPDSDWLKPESIDEQSNVFEDNKEI